MTVRRSGRLPPQQRPIQTQAAPTIKPKPTPKPKPQRQDVIDRRQQVPATLIRAAANVDPRIVQKLTTRADFDVNAAVGTNAGSGGMPEQKFLFDRETGEIYFIPKEIPYHGTFAIEVLGYQGTEETFVDEQYGREDRRFIAGTVTAYDTFDANGQSGAFGVSFWNGDMAHSGLILEAFKAVADGAPFTKGNLVYHPDSLMQELVLDANNGADRKALEKAGVPIFTTSDLAKHSKFTALNPGEGLGKLVIVQAGQQMPPLSRGNVVVFLGDIPAELPPLAGVIALTPQSMLSHNALKCRQDKTPYAYDRDIAKTMDLEALNGKPVRLIVENGKCTLEPASEDEVKARLEELRPKTEQTLHPDLTKTEYVPFSKIQFSHDAAFGSKAANLAVLRRMYQAGDLDVSDPSLGEPAIETPDGFGGPAYSYMTFMQTAMFDANTTLHEQVQKLWAEPRFEDDVAYRNEKLEELREVIEKADVPAELQAKFDKLEKDFAKKFPNENMRIRSSSGSEDLQGFSGAGLFDSFTFRYDRKDRPGRSLGDTFKKSFASIFTARAVEELIYYRIKPLTVTMNNAITPNEDGELANGVVRWGGGIAGGWNTMTVNCGVREQLITAGAGAGDNIVVGDYGLHRETQIQYLSKTASELLPGRDHVMTNGELLALFKSMQVIQEKFKALYKRQARLEGKPFDENKFFIECEFKIDSQGKLLIKQARPWVN